MPRARHQAATTQKWWVTNRGSASTMLRDELARVIGLLQLNPELGIRVSGRRFDGYSFPTQNSSSTTACTLARNGSRSSLSGVRLENSGRRYRPVRISALHQVSVLLGREPRLEQNFRRRAALVRQAEPAGSTASLSVDQRGGTETVASIGVSCHHRRLLLAALVEDLRPGARRNCHRPSSRHPIRAPRAGQKNEVVAGVLTQNVITIGSWICPVSTKGSFHEETWLRI
jgi:hypothetical protein